MEAGVALTAVQLDSTVKVAAAARKIPRDITYSPSNKHDMQAAAYVFFADHTALRLRLMITIIR
jgi:hypothetical protein